MYYNINIKSNNSEFILESQDKVIIEREMDLYFAKFFGASQEFLSKIKPVVITNTSLKSIDDFEKDSIKQDYKKEKTKQETKKINQEIQITNTQENNTISNSFKLYDIKNSNDSTPDEAKTSYTAPDNNQNYQSKPNDTIPIQEIKNNNEINLSDFNSINNGNHERTIEEIISLAQEKININQNNIKSSESIKITDNTNNINNVTEELKIISQDSNKPEDDTVLDINEDGIIEFSKNEINKIDIQNQTEIKYKEYEEKTKIENEVSCQDKLDDIFNDFGNKNLKDNGALQTENQYISLDEKYPEINKKEDMQINEEIFRTQEITEKFNLTNEEQDIDEMQEDNELKLEYIIQSLAQQNLDLQNLFNHFSEMTSIQDRFLICSYYIKYALNEEYFSIKTINSKLFQTIKEIADMSVVDELISKDYIKVIQNNEYTKYCITENGEKFLSTKFKK